MARLSIKDLEFFAYHGCHPLERKTGGTFKVDILIDYDMEMAVDSDNINEAVDYVSVMEIAKQEMAKRCDLIETVAKNTAVALDVKFPFVKSIEVIVYKMKVPLSHSLSYVSANYVIDKYMDN